MSDEKFKKIDLKYKKGKTYNGFYIGEVDKGDNKEGLGINFKDKSEIYHGEFSHNHYSGIGYLCSSTTNSIYIGQFSPTGLYNGIGNLSKPGISYKGEFESSKKIGIGIEETTTEVITGQFNGNEISGYCQVFNKEKNRVEFKGRMSNRRFNGFGMLMIDDSSSFIGELQNGKKQGFGIIRKKTENNFQRHFEHLQFSSHHELNDANDMEYYFGNWKNDKKNGFGLQKMIESSTVYYEGNFFHNEFSGYGRISNLSDGTTYIGELIQGKKHGFGRLNSEEYSYTGSWKLDQKSGLGLYKGRKESYFGLWKNGRRNGVAISKDGKYEYKAEWSQGQINGIFLMRERQIGGKEQEYQSVILDNTDRVKSVRHYPGDLEERCRDINFEGFVKIVQKKIVKIDKEIETRKDMLIRTFEAMNGKFRSEEEKVRRKKNRILNEFKQIRFRVCANYKIILDSMKDQGYEMPKFLRGKFEPYERLMTKDQTLNASEILEYLESLKNQKTGDHKFQRSTVRQEEGTDRIELSIPEEEEDNLSEKMSEKFPAYEEIKSSSRDLHLESVVKNILLQNKFKETEGIKSKVEIQEPKSKKNTTNLDINHIGLDSGLTPNDRKQDEKQEIKLIQTPNSNKKKLRKNKKKPKKLKGISRMKKRAKEIKFNSRLKKRITPKKKRSEVLELNQESQENNIEDRQGDNREETGLKNFGGFQVNVLKPTQDYSFLDSKSIQELEELLNSKQLELNSIEDDKNEVKGEIKNYEIFKNNSQMIDKWRRDLNQLDDELDDDERTLRISKKKIEKSKENFSDMENIHLDMKLEKKNLQKNFSEKKAEFEIKKLRLKKKCPNYLEVSKEIESLTSDMMLTKQLIEIDSTMLASAIKGSKEKISLLIPKKKEYLRKKELIKDYERMQNNLRNKKLYSERISKITERQEDLQSKRDKLLKIMEEIQKTETDYNNTNEEHLMSIVAVIENFYRKRKTQEEIDDFDEDYYEEMLLINKQRVANYINLWSNYFLKTPRNLISKYLLENKTKWFYQQRKIFKKIKNNYGTKIKLMKVKLKKQKKLFDYQNTRRMRFRPRVNLQGILDANKFRRERLKISIENHHIFISEMQFGNPKILAKKKLKEENKKSTRISVLDLKRDKEDREDEYLLMIINANIERYRHSCVRAKNTNVDNKLGRLKTFVIPAASVRDNMLDFVKNSLMETNEEVNKNHRPSTVISEQFSSGSIASSPEPPMIPTNPAMTSEIFAFTLTEAELNDPEKYDSGEKKKILGSKKKRIARLVNMIGAFRDMGIKMKPDDILKMKEDEFKNLETLEEKYRREKEKKKWERQYQEKTLRVNKERMRLNFEIKNMKNYLKNLGYLKLRILVISMQGESNTKIDLKVLKSEKKKMDAKFSDYFNQAHEVNSEMKLEGVLTIKYDKNSKNTIILGYFDHLGRLDIDRMEVTDTVSDIYHWVRDINVIENGDIYIIKGREKSLVLLDRDLKFVQRFSSHQIDPQFFGEFTGKSTTFLNSQSDQR